MASDNNSAGTAGYTIPNYEDPLGIAANYAKQFYGTDGTPKETKPPQPPKAQNSSPVSQKNGSSLPKTVQGVYNDTMTELNNMFPAHGCSIKLPALFKKLQLQTKMFPQVNTQRLARFGQWLGLQINPVIEAIKNFIKAIKAKIQVIMKFVKWIKKQIKIITQWLELFQEFMTFIMSLPAKLMQLVANCLAAAQQYASTLIDDTMKSLKNELSLSSESTGDDGTKANISPDFVDELGDIPGPDQVTIT